MKNNLIPKEKEAVKLLNLFILGIQETHRN